MRTKIMILGLICLLIFAYCQSPADPEIEKALNPDSNPGHNEPIEQEDLEQAVLEITTIPEVPVLHYYSGMDSSQGRCTLVVTETNGVGGYVGYTSTLNVFRLTFEPFETVSTPYNIYAKGRASAIGIGLEGWDDNGYEISTYVEIPVILEN